MTPITHREHTTLSPFFQNFCWFGYGMLETGLIKFPHNAASFYIGISTITLSDIVFTAGFLCGDYAPPQWS